MIKMTKTVREKRLEQAIKTLLTKCNKIAVACEDGVDDDPEEALEKIYKLLPDQSKYVKLLEN